VVSAPRADQDVAVVVDRETVWPIASEMTERHERRTVKTRGGHRAFTVSPGDNRLPATIERDCGLRGAHAAGSPGAIR
jgi:hypothetical protein